MHACMIAPKCVETMRRRLGRCEALLGFEIGRQRIDERPLALARLRERHHLGLVAQAASGGGNTELRALRSFVVETARPSNSRSRRVAHSRSSRQTTAFFQIASCVAIITGMYMRLVEGWTSPTAHKSSGVFTYARSRATRRE